MSCVAEVSQLGTGDQARVARKVEKILNSVWTDMSQGRNKNSNNSQQCEQGEDKDSQDDNSVLPKTYESVELIKHQENSRSSTEVNKDINSDENVTEFLGALVIDESLNMDIDIKHQNSIITTEIGEIIPKKIGGEPTDVDIERTLKNSDVLGIDSSKSVNSYNHVEEEVELLINNDSQEPVVQENAMADLNKQPFGESTKEVTQPVSKVNKTSEASASEVFQKADHINEENSKDTWQSKLNVKQCVLPDEVNACKEDSGSSTTDSNEVKELKCPSQLKKLPNPSGSNTLDLSEKQMGHLQEPLVIAQPAEVTSEVGKSESEIDASLMSNTKANPLSVSVLTSSSSIGLPSSKADSVSGMKRASSVEILANDGGSGDKTNSEGSLVCLRKQCTEGANNSSDTTSTINSSKIPSSQIAKHLQYTTGREVMAASLAVGLLPVACTDPVLSSGTLPPLSSLTNLNTGGTTVSSSAGDAQSEDSTAINLSKTAHIMTASLPKLGPETNGSDEVQVLFVERPSETSQKRSMESPVAKGAPPPKRPTYPEAHERNPPPAHSTPHKASVVPYASQAEMIIQREIENAIAIRKQGMRRVPQTPVPSQPQIETCIQVQKPHPPQHHPRPAQPKASQQFLIRPSFTNTVGAVRFPVQSGAKHYGPAPHRDAADIRYQQVPSHPATVVQHPGQQLIRQPLNVPHQLPQYVAQQQQKTVSQLQQQTAPQQRIITRPQQTMPLAQQQPVSHPPQHRPQQHALQQTLARPQQQSFAHPQPQAIPHTQQQQYHQPMHMVQPTQVVQVQVPHPQYAPVQHSTEIEHQNNPAAAATISPNVPQGIPIFVSVGVPQPNQVLQNINASHQVVYSTPGRPPVPSQVVIPQPTAQYVNQPSQPASSHFQSPTYMPRPGMAVPVMTPSTQSTPPTDQYGVVMNVIPRPEVTHPQLVRQSFC